MNDQVTAMMERARARASELAGAANVPATAPAPGGGSGGKSFGLDDFGGGFSCDTFLKVKPHGFNIGGDAATVFDEVVVTIDMAQVQVTRAIKAGNPARYWKTYDGNRAVSGETWEEACAKARELKPDAYDYPSADIPMRPVIDLKSKQGVVLADPTKTIGYSLATTNAANFKAFLKDVEDGGMKGGVVLVRLTVETRQKQGYQPWGVVKFEYLGPAEDGELEAAA